MATKSCILYLLHCKYVYIWPKCLKKVVFLIFRNCSGNFWLPSGRLRFCLPLWIRMMFDINHVYLMIVDQYNTYTLISLYLPFDEMPRQPHKPWLTCTWRWSLIIESCNYPLYSWDFSTNTWSKWPNQVMAYKTAFIRPLHSYKGGTWGQSQYHLTSIGIPMLKIRWSCDHLIFNMRTSIPDKDGLYIVHPGVF